MVRQNEVKRVEKKSVNNSDSHSGGISEAGSEGVSSALTGTSGESGEGGQALFIKARALNDLVPVYPPHAVRKGIEGKVLIDADISMEGNPLNVTVHRSSGYRILDRAAIECVRDAEFVPASCMGKAVHDRLRIAVSFSLQDQRAD